MKNFILHKSNGENIALISSERVCAVTSAKQRQELNGADACAFSVVSATPLNFSVGDWIEIYDKRYFLNQLPSITKKSEREFEYSLNFESMQYALIDILFFLKPIDQNNDYFVTSLTANLKTFLDNIVYNCNRIYGADKWAYSCNIDTDVKTIDYNNQNCLEVLQDLCTQFNAKFRVFERNGQNIIEVINNDTSTLSNFHFEYGRKGGLYQLSRKNVDSKNIITRLYAYGGSENLGNDYKEQNLCLPDVGSTAAAPKHKSQSLSYIQAEQSFIDLYGIKENCQTFDEIIPKGEFSVFSIDTENRNHFVAKLDFNLKEKKEDGKSTKWLIDGTEPKVIFQDGNLGGYEFAILDKTSVKKVGSEYVTDFWIKKTEDENGFIKPNPNSKAFQFDSNDKFIIVGINLPNSYIFNAQNELKAKAEEYLEEYKIPHVDYDVNISPFWVKNKLNELNRQNLFSVGDRVLITDSQLGIESKEIQITAFERNLITDYEISLTLGESVGSSTLQRVVGTLQSLKKVTNQISVENSDNQRLNYQANKEFREQVFDTEIDPETGEPYFADKIKPLSIETKHLSIGAKSEQFTLSNFFFEPNYQLSGENSYNSNYYSYNANNSYLIHNAILDSLGNSRIWQIAPIESPFYRSYESENAQYIYAVCPRSEVQTAAQILVTSEQITSEGKHGDQEDFENYYFLIGMLSSPQKGLNDNQMRVCQMTYGSTTINGRFIQTGRLQSNNGAAYFDLDSGEFRGDFKFTNENSAFNTQINGDLVVSKQIVVTNDDNKCAGLDGYSNTRAIYSGANWLKDDGKGDESSTFEVSYKGEVSLINRNNATKLEYIRFTPTKMMGSITNAVNLIVGGTQTATLSANSSICTSQIKESQWYTAYKGSPSTFTKKLSGENTSIVYQKIGKATKEGYLNLNHKGKDASGSYTISISKTTNCDAEITAKRYVRSAVTRGVYYSRTESGTKYWIGSYYDNTYFNIPSDLKDAYIWIGYGNLDYELEVDCNITKSVNNANIQIEFTAVYTSKLDNDIKGTLVAEAAYNEITPDGIFLSKASNQYVGLNARASDDIIFRAQADTADFYVKKNELCGMVSNNGYAINSSGFYRRALFGSSLYNAIVPCIGLIWNITKTSGSFSEDKLDYISASVSYNSCTEWGASGTGYYSVSFRKPWGGICIVPLEQPYGGNGAYKLKYYRTSNSHFEFACYNTSGSLCAYEGKVIFLCI